MPINIRDGDDDFDEEEQDDALHGEPVFVDGDIAPGPDERDRDLMDGSWEREYYSKGRRGLDWNAISIGLGILVLAGLVLPGLLVVFR